MKSLISVFVFLVIAAIISETVGADAYHYGNKNPSIAFHEEPHRTGPVKRLKLTTPKCDEMKAIKERVAKHKRNRPPKRIADLKDAGKSSPQKHVEEQDANALLAQINSLLGKN